MAITRIPAPTSNPLGTVAYEIDAPQSEAPRQPGSKAPAKAPDPKEMKGMKGMDMKGMKGM